MGSFMARVLFLEAGNSYGGSIMSLLTTLRSGLANWHHCTIGLYTEMPFSRDFVSSGAKVIQIRSKLAASHVGRFASRTYRINQWRQRILGASRLSDLLEVIISCPQVVLRVLPMSRVVAEAVTAHGIELLHLNDGPHWNFDGTLATTWTKIPCVCHLRSTQRLTNLERSLSKRHINRFMAVSNAVKDHFVQQGLPANRITVIHNAREPVQVNSQLRSQIRSSLGVGDQHLVLAFAGRLIARKGVGIMLESAGCLARVRDDFRVWIAGEGTGREGWIKWAAHLGLRSLVNFLGYREDIYSVLAAADVVVVPSTYADPFPSIVLEAMAVGRPVIASRIGGIPEAVMEGVTGFLVAPGAIDELASKMALLMDAPDLRLSMGLAAQERLKLHFDPVQQAHLIDEVYQDVLV